MQFQMQVGDPGKKTSGRQIDGEKDERVPCSFKCKQGFQGIKRQGRSIDREKENKSLNCQTYSPFGLKIRNAVPSLKL